MAPANTQFSKLESSYLFSTIDAKVAKLRAAHKNVTPLNLGVGDVALPLAKTLVPSLKEAGDALGRSVHGYGPTEGCLFLREKILEVEYPNLGLCVEDIFVSEGIVRDICDIQELFAPSATIGILDPTYPAYLKSSILAGREAHLISCLEENGFIPMPPNHPLDVVYLCTPNNPTGTAMTKGHLTAWVNWARKHNSVLLIDAAYESFITSKDVPKTIFEIEGAKEVAIEFRSFSKSAGFTGLRLGYTVIANPKWRALWKKRQDIKTNGVSFPIQKMGFASLFGEARKECRSQVQLYSAHASKLKSHLQSLGFTCYGGVDSPYIWWKVEGKDSWEYFDFLLHELHLITIPGRGFGLGGEGFIRLSSFITESTCSEAIKRFATLGDRLCGTK